MGTREERRLWQILIRQFFWPSISQMVRRFVRNCDSCGHNKVWRDRRQGFLKPLPIPNRIWREISIDFITGLPLSNGCTVLLVITDRLSKGVLLEACNDISAEAIAKLFLRVFYRRHGIPTAIVSDRGTQFVNALWACNLSTLTDYPQTLHSLAPGNRWCYRTNEPTTGGVLTCICGLLSGNMGRTY